MPSCSGLLRLPIPGVRPATHAYGWLPGLPAYSGNFVTGCTGNAIARKVIAECLPGDPRPWHVDAGNVINRAQTLPGYSASADLPELLGLRRNLSSLTTSDHPGNIP